MSVRWLYLSFVGKDGFQGCAYVQSDSEGKIFSINCLPDKPIEQIAAILVPAKMNHKIPKDHKWHDRLLTKEEFREAENGEIVNARGEAV